MTTPEGVKLASLSLAPVRWGYFFSNLSKNSRNARLAISVSAHSHDLANASILSASSLSSLKLTVMYR